MLDKGEMRMFTAKHLADQWMAYAKREGLRRNSIRYQNHQAAFLSGVFASLGHETPPIIVIYGMTGRDLYDLTQEPVAV